jgi:hypothetical protein
MLGWLAWRREQQALRRMPRHGGAWWSRPVCPAAMATTPVAPACPIRLVSFRLAARGSTEARSLFLDGEGHISADPHWLPREQALLLAHNQQLIWGSAARVLVL